MDFSSTDYLRHIVEFDCLVLLEKAVPAGTLKREVISLRLADGSPAVFRSANGFIYSPDIPRIVLDDFLRENLMVQDRPEDPEGRIFFRLTADGRARVAT